MMAAAGLGLVVGWFLGRSSAKPQTQARLGSGPIPSRNRGGDASYQLSVTS